MGQSIKELDADEVDLVIQYFLSASRDFLEGMGVDPEKLPREDDWRRLLLEDLQRPLQNKNFYYFLWEIDNTPVGHCNINKIKCGYDAFMHLHLWRPEIRHRGLGSLFVCNSICKFFELFDLQALFCEPYAENPAANKTLEKVGFTFVRSYETTPGWINYRQKVNRWVLTKEKLNCLYQAGRLGGKAAAGYSHR